MEANTRFRRAAAEVRASAGVLANTVGFMGVSFRSLQLLAFLGVVGAAGSTSVIRERTFDCAGAPDGAPTCSGCSSQFARHSLCEACLAETLDVGPVCRRCHAGKAVGPIRSATCQPVCFYCLGCEQRPLAEMGGSGESGVDTCNCDLSRLRKAFEERNGRSRNAAAVAEMWDGRHGIMMVDRDENRTGIIDGCHLQVGCEKHGGRHVTVLLSSSCSTTAVSRSPASTIPAVAPAVAAAVLDGSSASDSGGSSNSHDKNSNRSSSSRSRSGNNVRGKISSGYSSNSSSSSNAEVFAAVPSIDPILTTNQDVFSTDDPILTTNQDVISTDEPLVWPTTAHAGVAVTVPEPSVRSAQSGVGAASAAAGIFNERTRYDLIELILFAAAATASVR